MPVVTVSNGQICLPREMVEQLGVEDGDSVVVEAVARRLLQVRPTDAGAADEALLQALDAPYDLGVIGSLSRSVIYDETD